MKKKTLRRLVESIVCSHMPTESMRLLDEYLTEYPEWARWHCTPDYHVAAAIDRIAKANVRMSVSETEVHCRCLLDNLHCYRRNGRVFNGASAREEWLELLRLLPAEVVMHLYPRESLAAAD